MKHTIHTQEQMTIKLLELYDNAYTLLINGQQPLLDIVNQSDRLFKLYKTFAYYVLIISYCWVSENTLLDIRNHFKSIKGTVPLPKEFIDPIISYLDWQTAERL